MRSVPDVPPAVSNPQGLLTFRGRPVHGRHPSDGDRTRIDKSLATSGLHPEALGLLLFLLSYDEYGPTSKRGLDRQRGTKSRAARSLHALRLAGLTHRVGDVIYVSDVPITAWRRAAFIVGDE
jgi:hypothetical protein